MEELTLLKLKTILVVLGAFLTVATACTPETLATRIPVATVDVATTVIAGVTQLPATWTPLPDLNPEVTPALTMPPPPSSTPLPTATAVPATATPQPIATDTAVPTDTPLPPTNTPLPATATNTPNPASPTPLPPPTNTPPPVYSGNLLPNGSFEEGHYNMSGIAELQIPNGWLFEWDEGPTGFGENHVYFRPETRVLPSASLPPAEHPLFIYNGQYTVKVFKGYGPISFRLMTDVYLEPGTYTLEVNIFPDLYVDYVNNQKVWAGDPYSGEVRFIVTGASTDWFLPQFGMRNTFTHTFTVQQAGAVRVGFGMRGRYGILNNGWFMDDWSLRRVEG